MVLGNKSSNFGSVHIFKVSSSAIAKDTILSVGLSVLSSSKLLFVLMSNFVLRINNRRLLHFSR